MTSKRNNIYRRIRRRETHSPRSAAAIVLAILLILTFAWLAVEIVLSMANLPPLLVTPHDMSIALTEITALSSPVLIGSGLTLALLGVILIALTLAPGRRARHAIDSEETIAIVDDEVLASAVARQAAVAAQISPDNARVTVSHRGADVRLTPTSGYPINRTAVLAAVEDEVESYKLDPKLRAPRLFINARGKVGA